MAKIKFTQLNDTTYKIVPKDDPKDRIEVEIGDSKQPDKFYPQVKLMRWDNEVNFSVRMIDDNTGIVSKVGEKIIYDKPDRKIEFFEGDNAHKFVWYLKKKPASNKIEFTIKTKGLDFFYQPELTQQKIDRGATRPKNVVGSYAIYHKTKGGLNDSRGKDYKVGKAFHVYRPKIMDAEGSWTWGILNIDVEKEIYSVEIPQDFLDKAVYPIKSNDTFGFDGIGANVWTFSGSSFGTDFCRRVGTPSAPEFTGTLDNVKFYALTNVGAGVTIDTTAWVNEEDSGGGGIHGEIGEHETIDEPYDTDAAPPDLHTINFASENITAGIKYIINITADPTDLVHGNQVNVKYDEPGDKSYAEHKAGVAAYANNKEDPWVYEEDDNLIFSIYATYTPAAPPAAAVRSFGQII